MLRPSRVRSAMPAVAEHPADPITALVAAAAQQHELYLAYVAAGFTSAQAMQLICAMVAAAVNQQAGHNQN